MYFPKRFLNFDIIGVLGSGSYGSVLVAVDYITKTKVAIKFVRKGKVGSEHDFNLEPKIQSMLSHGNICKLYGCLDMSSNLILILEMVNGMDLQKYLKKYGKIDENCARQFFIQIIDAIDYLHAHRVVHRDLKLENIIVEDGGGIKICDFGLSTFYHESSMLEDYCGTPQCAPPEIMNGIPYVGPEVDIWCLGVILYAMVHGRLPFDQKDNRSLSRHILQAKMTIDESLSCDLKDLIRRLIEPRKLVRIKMDQIVKHPWLNMVRKEHRRKIVFVDKEVVERLVGMGFKREVILKNLSDENSKESALYSLVKEKLSLGYYPRVLGNIVPYHSCDLVDLDFVNNLESNREHKRSMERHRILQDISSVGRGGCFPFLFWSRKRVLLVKKDLNADLKKSKMIVEKCLLEFSKVTFQKGHKYVVYHINGLEMNVELTENNLFTTCCFRLTRGDRLEFAELVASFIRLADKDSLQETRC